VARIFLSYRRADSPGHTGRIFDHLTDRFGENSVFMDVRGIEPGENFAKIIEARLADCDALVVVIGRHWLPSVDGAGTGRIEATTDYVRMEIETAVRLEVEIIPVLVGGAAMPRAEESPEGLSELAFLQALELDDKAFRSGTERLIATLERTIARSQERRRLRRPVPKEARQTLPAPAGAPNAPHIREHSQPVRMGIARILMLYTPAHKLTWILHFLFWLLLTVLLIATPSIWFDLRDKAVVLEVAGIYVGLLCVVRAIALVVEPDQTTSRIRRWFLLFKPPRSGMAVLHVVFLLMLVVVALLLTVLPAMLRQETDQAKFMMILVSFLWGLTAFIVRELGTARDPLRPAGTEPNWFVRSLYLQRPRRASAWLPRFLFYASCFVALILAPNIFVDDHDQMSLRQVPMNGGDLIIEAAYLAILISARGWAASIERRARISTGSTAGWVRQSLCLYVPQNRFGFLPIVLFWIAIALMVGLAVNRAGTLGFLRQPGEQSQLYFLVLAALVAVASHEWARLYPRRSFGLAAASTA
jgi:TIR domain